MEKLYQTNRSKIWLWEPEIKFIKHMHPMQILDKGKHAIYYPSGWYYNLTNKSLFNVKLSGISIEFNLSNKECNIGDKLLRIRDSDNYYYTLLNYIVYNNEYINAVDILYELCKYLPKIPDLLFRIIILQKEFKRIDHLNYD